MNSWKLWAVCCVCLVLSGCAYGGSRSPKELLALSVSGLSGVDRYTFSGDAGIGSGSQTVSNPVAFHGTVEDHKVVKVKGSSMNALTSTVNPLELLNSIKAAAVKTELVPEESNDEQTVLRVTTDPKHAAAKWATQLRGEFGLLEKKVPANLTAKQQGGQMHNAAGPSALHEEWNGEIARSKRELEAMLSTMQVQSSCKLVIDRKKMLPRSLEERTIFRYQADGKPAEENRMTRLNFNL